MCCSFPFTVRCFMTCCCSLITAFCLWRTARLLFCRPDSNYFAFYPSSMTCVQALANQSLIQVEFFSVHDYLYGLHRLASELKSLGPRACLYLAAAVSDFYISRDQLAEHKIQSSSGKLTLQMEPVPKLLHLIKPQLCPKSFMVTFKLETDEALLAQKAKRALDSYHHQVVVANLLHTRHREVTVYCQDDRVTHIVRQKEHKDIEISIVAFIAEEHTRYLSD
eukprot:m.70303 g.70303  ORF g.70303 m.70303 type:complete len:222 (-) comp13773_c0_seq1:29-694(-)